MLEGAPGFDLVFWGWNFDAVMQVELFDGASATVLADQAALRSGVDAFREGRAAPTLFKLRKALGICCYTISPAGAATLLARAVPIRPMRLSLPLMPHEVANVTFDVSLASLYADLCAYVAMPPLAATRNDWSLSTVRNAAEPLAAEQALVRADGLQAGGRLGEAVAVIQAAAVAAPADPALWSRLGTLLTEQGHVAAAAAALERALALRPASEAALYNLARVRLLQGRGETALDLLDRAVAIAPRFAAAHANRGVALLALGRAAEAQAAFGQAVHLQPKVVEAQRGLAAACLALGDLDAAAAAQAAALALSPDDQALIEGLADIHLQIAAKRRADGDLVEAAHHADLAARAPSRRLEARLIGSDLLERLGRFDQSWIQANEAVRLDPASPHALNNLGLACLRLNRAPDAERAYRAALALAPAYAEAHHGLAFALLKQGRFAEGWPEYDWRLRIPAAGAWIAAFDRPMWQGDRLPGATLLLAAEQGLGDTLWAACLIAEAWERVGSLVVQAPAALVSLLGRIPGVDAVVADGAPRPPHDVWLPMMSLPGRLGLDLARRPPAQPRLVADPERTAAWRSRMPQGGFRIGVAWQGNPKARVEHGRSFPLAAIEPLAAAPEVVLVSLQKAYGAEQLASRPAGLNGMVDLGAAYQAGDFDDTAAIVANLDLVICCDTAIAHLAGGLGRPVWIALGDNPDWRWPAEGERTPWYGTAKLFRRSRQAPWTTLFAAMAVKLGGVATR